MHLSQLAGTCWDFHTDLHLLRVPLLRLVSHPKLNPTGAKLWATTGTSDTHRPKDKKNPKSPAGPRMSQVNRAPDIDIDPWKSISISIYQYQYLAPFLEFLPAERRGGAGVMNFAAPRNPVSQPARLDTLPGISACCGWDNWFFCAKALFLPDYLYLNYTHALLQCRGSNLWLQNDYQSSFHQSINNPLYMRAELRNIS